MGKFTVTSAYKLLAGHYVNASEQKWTKIWNIDAAERVRVFMWQILTEIWNIGAAK
ncbi:hypothetical protein A2U01_0069615, partial [Trifolium medium]|nr:hypothetical protein [Trifolium medium]